MINANLVEISQLVVRTIDESCELVQEEEEEGYK